MKKQFLLFSLMLVICISASAQMKPGGNNPTTQAEIRNEIERERNVQDRLENQRTRPSFPIGPGYSNPRIISARQRRSVIKSIFRMPTEAELAAISPRDEDAARFSEFLKQPDTGIFKLVPDQGCFTVGKIVVVRPECEIYTLPGFGAAYSFRVKTYRIPTIADLFYKDDKFFGGSSLTQKIFAEIGDVPLEKVDLQTAGMKFLIDFKAKTDDETFKKTAVRLEKGIEKDGFQYRSATEVKVGSTYILRSIAYEGTVVRSIEGAFYNELDWDERKDVIVAFRVIRQEADKSVTILWKELKRQDAPKISIQ